MVQCINHINFPQSAKRELSHLSKSKTYMDDMRVGVPVVYSNEKVYHELGAVFHVQLGDDILQPPQFVWRKEMAGAIERRKLLVALAQGDRRRFYRIQSPSCLQQWASHTHQAACRATGPHLSSQSHLTYLYNNHHINSTQNVEVSLKRNRNFCTFLCDM